MAWTRERREGKLSAISRIVGMVPRVFFLKNVCFFAFFRVMREVRERIRIRLVGNCFVTNHFI